MTQRNMKDEIGKIVNCESWDEKNDFKCCSKIENVCVCVCVCVSYNVPVSYTHLDVYKRQFRRDLF